jgi:hypothetical protein
MVRDPGHLETETLDPDDPLPEDIPRDVRQTEDLEPDAWIHAGILARCLSELNAAEQETVRARTRSVGRIRLVRS